MRELITVAKATAAAAAICTAAFGAIYLAFWVIPTLAPMR